MYLAEVKLVCNIGEAKKGEVYVHGLFEQPASHPNTHRNDWWWQKGSEYSENKFLPNSVMTGEKQ